MMGADKDVRRALPPLTTATCTGRRGSVTATLRTVPFAAVAHLAADARRDGAYLVAGKKPWHRIGAFVEGALVATGALMLLSATRASVRGLYVLPFWREYGIQTAMLLRLVADARRMGLRTVETHTIHPNASLRVGFVPTGRTYGQGSRRGHVLVYHPQEKE